MSGEWAGIGEALELANREWNVHLMPQTVADMRQEVASRYARNPTQPFGSLLEEVIELDFEIDRNSNEWSAAKQVLGTLFSERRRKRHQYNYTKVGD